MKISDKSKLKSRGETKRGVREITRDWIRLGLKPSLIMREIKNMYGIELDVVDLIKIAL